MKKFALALLAALAVVPVHAGTYVQQSTFPVATATISGLDRDLVGNLYVFGLTAGATTYRVTGYQTPGITPQFSFDTGISTPAAFAVEDSGIVDVVDVSSGFALKRFTNTGAFIGQSTFILNPSPYVTPQYFAAAIDKANKRVYLTYQLTSTIYRVQCVGCATGPSTQTNGYINQYDFNGTLLLTTAMPGNNNTTGSCYTPYMMAADPQGDLYVADPYCQHVVEYSLSGSLLGSVPTSWVASFQPHGMWTDSASSLYISQPVCGPAGCSPGIVKVAGGSFQTSFVTDSAVGCAWDPRILYTSASGAAPLRRFIYDGAPTVSPETSPLGSTGQHSAAAALAWQAAGDPDGDPIGYSVYLGTSPNQFVLIGTTTQTSFASQPLTFGVTYYWQVIAADSYLSLPLLQAPSPVVSFNLGFFNNPPGAFAVTGGTGTLVTRATSATLAWQASVDPDGDPVLYDVSWRPAAQSSATIITTADNSLVMTGLSSATTYYWSVLARDNYGATTPMAGGTQPLQLVFKNSPPSAVVLLTTATSYGLHTFTPSVTLGWLPSTDPDGDTVSYQLDIQTSTGSWPSLAMGGATSFPLSLQFETTYFYRVDAADPYGGVATGTWTPLIAHLANRPPYPIVYTSANSVTTRAMSYTLTWQDTGDPDGDSVTYGLYLSTDPSAQPLVQQGTQTSYALALQFGTTVYWRVSATDTFGARTDGTLQAFLPVFKNSAPPAPLPAAGTGVLSEHSLTPQVQLAWSTVQDPDGDPVSYQLAVGTSANSLAVTQISSATASTVPVPSFGTTYYWQVSAIDPYGATSTSAVQNLLLTFQNNPPGPFAVLTGTGTLATRTTSELLTWGNSADPDGDSVTYAVTVATTPGNLALVQSSTATTYALNFQSGTTYYWSVAAFDGFGGTTTISGGTQSFIPTFLNQAPQVVQLMPPFDGSPTITTMRNTVTVSWGQVTTPQNDPVTYTISLGDSAGDIAPVAQIGQGLPSGASALSVRPLTMKPQAQAVMNGNTITLTLTGLDYYRTYYLKIQASNPYGATSVTPVQTFTLASATGFPLAYNYPNPFSPMRGGTNIVFNAPPSGYARAEVAVYSELGDLMFKQDYANVAPGISQVPFAGRDRFGKALFNGSYVCRVRFEGPDDRVTFYLLVVK